jgi:alkylation response protein AidB-like acyl-CoA dehydrogenase
MSSGLANEQVGWELDAEHREFAAVCRAFTDRHVRPAVGEAEALGHLPPRLWKELGAAGLLGLPIPAEHRGSGDDQPAVTLLAEELALARGDSVAAIAVTEPGAGSDVAAITTTAARDGPEYRLAGRKGPEIRRPFLLRWTWHNEPFPRYHMLLAHFTEPEVGTFASRHAGRAS